MNEKIYKKLVCLSKKAYKNKDIPVAAVVVCNNKIISTGYNKRIKNNLSGSHAEIIAIIKANKIKRNWRLDDCEMYVTLKPCKMCEEYIKESRIRKVYYYADRNKENSNTIEHIKIDKNSNYFEKLLKQFFSEIR